MCQKLNFVPIASTQAPRSGVMAAAPTAAPVDGGVRALVIAEARLTRSSCTPQRATAPRVGVALFLLGMLGLAAGSLSGGVPWTRKWSGAEGAGGLIQKSQGAPEYEVQAVSAGGHSTHALVTHHALQANNTHISFHHFRRPRSLLLRLWEPRPHHSTAPWRRHHRAARRAGRRRWYGN